MQMKLVLEDDVNIHVLAQSQSPVYPYQYGWYYNAIRDPKIAIPRNCDPHPKSSKMRSEKYRNAIPKELKCDPKSTKRYLNKAKYE